MTPSQGLSWNIRSSLVWQVAARGSRSVMREWNGLQSQFGNEQCEYKRGQFIFFRLPPKKAKKEQKTPKKRKNNAYFWKIRPINFFGSCRILNSPKTSRNIVPTVPAFAHHWLRSFLSHRTFLHRVSDYNRIALHMGEPRNLICIEPFRLRQGHQYGAVHLVFTYY